jgi:flagellar hook-basal body complex protein FliE
MPVNFSTAIAAYMNSARALGQPGAADGPPTGASAIGQAFKDVMANTAEVMQNAEQKSMAAVGGKTEIADVVIAVSNAEVTLQTVVAVRDRVIQAYQDILRMPI